MKTLLQLVGVLLAALPLAIISTLLLIPFWRWLEEATGIESIGHSGPADWCYLLLFVVFCLVGGAIVVQRGRSKRA